jgi:hypothetical protein
MKSINMMLLTIVAVVISLTSTVALPLFSKETQTQVLDGKTYTFSESAWTLTATSYYPLSLSEDLVANDVQIVMTDHFPRMSRPSRPYLPVESSPHRVSIIFFPST